MSTTFSFCAAASDTVHVRRATAEISRDSRIKLPRGLWTHPLCGCFGHIRDSQGRLPRPPRLAPRQPEGPRSASALWAGQCRWRIERCLSYGQCDHNILKGPSQISYLPSHVLHLLSPIPHIQAGFLPRGILAPSLSSPVALASGPERSSRRVVLARPSGPSSRSSHVLSRPREIARRSSRGPRSFLARFSRVPRAAPERSSPVLARRSRPVLARLMDSGLGLARSSRGSGPSRGHSWGRPRALSVRSSLALARRANRGAFGGPFCLETRGQGRSRGPGGADLGCWFSRKKLGRRGNESATTETGPAAEKSTGRVAESVPWATFGEMGSDPPGSGARNPATMGRSPRLSLILILSGRDESGQTTPAHR
jgi:hypothetical protein